MPEMNHNELQKGTDSPIWDLALGEGPIVATANHDGHELRDEVAALTALSKEQRLREEDPHTGQWASIATTRIIARRSRFEVDLNRSRETAVYRTPEDAWGLVLWKAPLPEDVVARSLAEHDAFYAELERILIDKARLGCFVVLDLHSYNHRRGGPDAPAADASGNPEVNIGTGTMDRDRWGRLVDRFIADLSGFDFLGRHLDVRENVKFVGRQFPRWVHTRFPTEGCALAIEVKKFFMDEWTGELYRPAHDALRDALATTLPGLLEELAKAADRA
jgi:hypothetical protein